MTGKMLLAAVMVMQVLNTTCSQWPCSTQSSEFQETGRVKVMFISSCASRPKHRNIPQVNSLAFLHLYCYETQPCTCLKVSIPAFLNISWSHVDIGIIIVYEQTKASDRPEGRRYLKPLLTQLLLQVTGEEPPDSP